MSFGKIILNDSLMSHKCYSSDKTKNRKKCVKTKQQFRRTFSGIIIQYLYVPYNFL